MKQKLPNGICVEEQINSTNNYGDDSFFDEWVASVEISSWHYSQGGATKEKAIRNLLIHIKAIRDQFEERLKPLNNFLETENV